MTWSAQLNQYSLFAFLSLYSFYSPFLASEQLHSYLFLFIAVIDLYYTKAN